MCRSSGLRRSRTLSITLDSHVRTRSTAAASWAAAATLPRLPVPLLLLLPDVPPLALAAEALAAERSRICPSTSLLRPCNTSSRKESWSSTLLFTRWLAPKANCSR
jgi:hypothetical protein